MGACLKKLLNKQESDEEPLQEGDLTVVPQDSRLTVELQDRKNKDSEKDSDDSSFSSSDSSASSDDSTIKSNNSNVKKKQHVVDQYEEIEYDIEDIIGYQLKDYDQEALTPRDPPEAAQNTIKYYNFVGCDNRTQCQIERIKQLEYLKQVYPNTFGEKEEQQLTQAKLRQQNYERLVRKKFLEFNEIEQGSEYLAHIVVNDNKFQMDEFREKYNKKMKDKFKREAAKRFIDFDDRLSDLSLSDTEKNYKSKFEHPEFKLIKPQVDYGDLYINVDGLIQGNDPRTNQQSEQVSDDEQQIVVKAKPIK